MPNLIDIKDLFCFIDDKTLAVKIVDKYKLKDMNVK